MENDLPKEWLLIKVSDVSEIIRGITYQKSDASSSKFENSCLVLRGGNIQDGKIVIDDDLVYVHNSLIKEEQKLRLGDVIIVGSTGSQKLIGKAAFSLSDENEISFGAFLALMRPSKLMESRFFDYFFLTDFYRNEIRELAGGININNVRREHLEGLDFPLPPLPEQQRIVAKLDTLFGKIDRIKTSMERIPQLLKDFRQKVLTQAVTGKLTEEWSLTNHYTPVDLLLGEIEGLNKPSRYNSRNTSIIPGRYAISVGQPNLLIPDRYKWIELVSIARLETGHTPSRNHPEYWGGDIKWIGIKDAKDFHGATIFDTYQKPTQLGIDNSAARVLPKGTVCFSRTASVGYVVVTGENMATSQDFVNWVCSKAINPYWLQILLMAEIDSILSFGKGTTHTTIYFPEVISFHVALPPIEEQQEIVRRVDSLFAKADKIEARYQKLKEKIEQLPQAILAKAFRGELVEQLPTDGDARDLLEQIKQSKAGLEKSGKSKKLKVDDEVRMVAEERVKYGKR